MSQIKCLRLFKRRVCIQGWGFNASQLWHYSSMHPFIARTAITISSKYKMLSPMRDRWCYRLTDQCVSSICSADVFIGWERYDLSDDERRQGFRSRRWWWCWSSSDRRCWSRVQSPINTTERTRKQDPLVHTKATTVDTTNTTSTNYIRILLCTVLGTLRIYRDRLLFLVLILKEDCMGLALSRC